MAKSNRKPEPIPLCPLAGFSPCHRQHCALWDDDWKLCSLNYGSVYSSVRAAACDAAVEVAREYVGERERGALSAFGHFPTAVGKQDTSYPPLTGHLDAALSLRPPLNGKALGEADEA